MSVVITIAELIAYLRLSVKLQNEEYVDDVYLSMSDEDIQLYIKIVATRDFPDISITNIPSANIYPITLLAKKELYHTLAVAKSDDVDLTSAEGASIKQSAKFEHYMKLIAQVTLEYDKWVEDGGASTKNTLTSYDVLLSDRYATRRNREKGVIPTVTVSVESITNTSVELSWTVSVSRFCNYKIYICSDTIYDPFAVRSSTLKDSINSSAKLLFTLNDIHQTTCRIEGLVSNTTYHILIGATDLSSLFGVDEVVITTEE